MTATTDAVTELRTHWATRFTDAVDVTRVSSRGTFNPTTLGYDSSADASVYTGVALIRPGDAGDKTIYGDALVTGKPMHVYAPHDAAVFQVEDEITVTACAFDAYLVGKTFTVLGFGGDSYQTRMDLVCRFDLGVGYVE